MSWVAVGVGGSALVGGGLSFLGASSQSKKVRQAMQDYINYTEGQRNTFLNQPESSAIRKKLESYIPGDQGYNADILSSMKSGVQEAYGNSLADMTRLTGKAGAASTGVYTPGRADRTSRLLGQNIAANRANSIRDIHQKNADVALNNQRLAISALPTYLPGMPATQPISPDVFLKKAEEPHWGSFLGPAIAQAGQQIGIYGPLMQRMLGGGQASGGGTLPTPSMNAVNPMNFANEGAAQGYYSDYLRSMFPRQ